MTLPANAPAAEILPSPMPAIKPALEPPSPISTMEDIRLTNALRGGSSSTDGTPSRDVEELLTLQAVRECEPIDPKHQFAAHEDDCETDAADGSEKDAADDADGGAKQTDGCAAAKQSGKGGKGRGKGKGGKGRGKGGKAKAQAGGKTATTILKKPAGAVRNPSYVFLSFFNKEAAASGIFDFKEMRQHIVDKWNLKQLGAHIPDASRLGCSKCVQCPHGCKDCNPAKGDEHDKRKNAAAAD